MLVSSNNSLVVATVGNITKKENEDVWQIEATKYLIISQLALIFITGLENRICTVFYVTQKPPLEVLIVKKKKLVFS